MSNVYDDLSNEELREELVKRGLIVGPITATTRKLYTRKLTSLAAAGDAEFNAPHNRTPLVDLTDEVELLGDKDVFEDVGDHEGTPDSEAVETDTNGHGTTEHEHESDQSDYMESSRILTPEETKNRFISPMAHRRKMVKKSQSRMQMIVMFILGVVTVYAFFYFVGQNMYMNNKDLAVKTADTEL
uniref:LEM domain-containing protein n=1 Tax=Panagrolaimus superbus TaxID=310955 RepID=A0A914YG56_9BILA